MAVQKSKVTRSRRGQRRSHDSLKASTLSIDPVSGEKHARHQMTKDGFYKGRLVKDLRKVEKEDLLNDPKETFKLRRTSIMQKSYSKHPKPSKKNIMVPTPPITINGTNKYRRRSSHGWNKELKKLSYINDYNDKDLSLQSFKNNIIDNKAAMVQPAYSISETMTNFFQQSIFSKDMRDENELDYSLSLIKRYNVIKACYQKAQHYINLASNSLSVFNDCEEKNILENLTSFSLSRNF